MTTQLSNSQVAPQSTRSLLLGIWGHLTRRRRLQLGVLLAVMLVSGLAEVVSLGAVLPFLAVLSDPDRIWRQQLTQELATRVGLTEPSQLLLPATLIFALASVLAALVRLANLWLNGRLAAAVGSDLSCEAYRRTLYQPYEVHVQRNSSSVITGATTQIAFTVVALNNLLQLITSAVVAAGLFVGLLLIDISVALGAAVFFGAAYGLLAITANRHLLSNGKKIADASNQQLKALQEGLGAIRDVLLEGNQFTYLEIYRKADRPQRQLQAKNAFISIFPRYAMEAIVMVGIAFLGGLLVLQKGNVVFVIPLLGGLAFGAQRLLPALQQIYSCWSKLTSYNAAMQAVLTLLNQPLQTQLKVSNPLSLRKSIHLENIHFSYGIDQPKVLNGLNMEILRGERIGLVGSTGSGKSTMVDLVMGLLKPNAGRLLIDGIDLHDPEHPELLLAWRASIAHVPQTIYLADCTIAENIAFGVSREHIDIDLMKHAASQAQISGFIESSPQGYDTYVGERGIRLSGGQRQRLGIARALYKKSTILVLDEATSALDNDTEKSVMASLDEVSNELTIIMIAHRLSTLKRCHRVVHFKDGNIEECRGPSFDISTN